MTHQELIEATAEVLADSINAQRKAILCGHTGDAADLAVAVKENAIAYDVLTSDD